MDKNLQEFIGGVGLAGKRLKNGNLKSYLSSTAPEIADWPQEITLFNHTYTLEEVTKGKDGYECAEYV